MLFIWHIFTAKQMFTITTAYTFKKQTGIQFEKNRIKGTILKEDHQFERQPIVE